MEHSPHTHGTHEDAREATEGVSTFVVLPDVDCGPVTVFADGSYVRGWVPSI